MGKLVQSNKSKKVIERGPDIKPRTTFSIHDIKAKTKKGYQPKPTTLKIDTRLRDQINALSLIGYGETQKETIEILINQVIEAMTVDEKRKFDNQFKILEEKTIRQLQN